MKLENGQPCDYNPRNLQTPRHGICRCSDHDDNTDNAPKRTEVRLVMEWSDEYIKHLGTTYPNDDDFDKAYDELENKHYKYGTESWYCEKCIEESCE